MKSLVVHHSNLFLKELLRLKPLKLHSWSQNSLLNGKKVRMKHNFLHDFQTTQLILLRYINNIFVNILLELLTCTHCFPLSSSHVLWRPLVHYVFFVGDYDCY